jgi:hypothetical protein
MITNSEIRSKLGWEGWPEALEWFDPEEVEDPEVAIVLSEAMGLYLRLDELHMELIDILGDDDE